MSTTRIVCAGAFVLSLGVAACGGNRTQPAVAPPAAAPPVLNESPATAPVASSAAPVATPEAEPTPSSTEVASPAEEPAETPTEESVRPLDALTAPGVAFMLDDPGSELAQKLTELCAKKLPKEKQEDPGELAKCRLEQRDKFKADVFVFRNEGGGLKWIVYQRRGTALPEVYSASVKLVDERSTSFKIRPLSGQGARPLFKTRAEVPVDMPSRTEIVLDEPEFGRLVYRAKTGLVGN